MEIKYEAVFGPQELFDCASDDAVLAIKDTTSGRIHSFTNDGWVKSGLKHERHIGTSDNQIAMRRIIKTPAWTREDKQVGRPPEVGSIFTYKNETLTCHFIDCNGEIWAHDIDNNVVTPLLRDCRPIETPTEKAQRLEDEWVNKAFGKTPVFGGVGDDENNRLRTHLRHIYRAQLSGKLPVPVKGE